MNQISKLSTEPACKGLFAWITTVVFVRRFARGRSARGSTPRAGGTVAETDAYA